MSDPVLALEGLTRRFGEFAAVDDASLRLRRGEVLALLGPSGCGKTTLLRLVAGFERPDSGCVLLGGRDVTALPPWKRDVNTVFQQGALFPHLDVFDNVAFGPRTRGEAEAETRRRVERMLAIVRISPLARRRPAALSGGEKQRVALARALVNAPLALLLDEPLSALDLELRRAMQAELRRIQRETGGSFLLVTHDQEEAMAVADRIAVMKDGRIRQVGTPEEVHAEPASPFVASFLGAANLLPARVLSVEGGQADVELATGSRGRLDPGGLAAGAAAFVMVRPERVRLEASRPRTPAAGFAVDATLREAVFLGASLRCTLEDRSGATIVASLDGAHRPEGLEPGATLWACWDSGAARLLGATEELP